MAYTTIDKPTDYFNTVLYTGNNNTNAQTVGFQPDWVWLKVRSAGSGQDHTLYDSVRGATKFIEANSASAEATGSNYLTSFDSNGFTLGNDQSHVNASGDTYVSWNWKAGGSASSNSNGSITSSVSANQTAGFSIVSWTGSGSSATIGHGLGATPKCIIVKNRTDAVNWFLYNSSVITAGATNKSFMTLNTTDALGANGTATTFTSVSSTTFGVGTDNIINGSSDNMIAYCFADTGNKFFKAGSYTGNGSSSGTMIFCGFKPSFVLQKSTAVQGWQLQDNKRLGYNGANKLLQPHDSALESDVNRIDILSNGFKVRTTDAGQNTSGQKYIYMAFAENPFVTSSGVPATAR